MPWTNYRTIDLKNQIFWTWETTFGSLRSQPCQSRGKWTHATRKFRTVAALYLQQRHKNRKLRTETVARFFRWQTKQIL